MDPRISAPYRLAWSLFLLFVLVTASEVFGQSTQPPSTGATGEATSAAPGGTPAAVEKPDQTASESALSADEQRPLHSAAGASPDSLAEGPVPATAPQDESGGEADIESLRGTGGLNGQALPIPVRPLQEVGPGLIWLPDRNGGYLPLPGWTYEQVMERLQGGQPGRPELLAPVLERVEGEGVWEAGELHWTLQYTWSQALGARQLELGLQGCEPRAESEASKPLELSAGEGQLLRLANGNLQARLSKVTTERLTLTVRVRQSVLNFGGRHELQVFLPPNLQSKLTLQVVHARGSFQLLGNGNVLELQGERAGCVLEGLSGAGKLSWREPTASDAWPHLELQVTARNHLGPSHLECTADLQLTGMDRDLGTMRIVLPAGAELLSDGANRQSGQLNAYRVQQEASPAVNPNGAVLLVTPTFPQTRKLGVTLRYQIPLVVHGEEALQFRGAPAPVVDSVAKLSGWVLLTSSEEWLVQVQQAQGLQRLFLIPEGEKELGKVGWAWRLDRQPAEVALTAARRPARVVVTPSYACRLNAEHADLRATFSFDLNGQTQEELEIDPRGWQLLSAECEVGGTTYPLLAVAPTVPGAEAAPATASNLVNPSAARRYRFPPELPQASLLSVTLQARMNWGDQEAEVGWNWPIPLASELRPGQATLAAEPDLQYQLAPGLERGHTLVTGQDSGGRVHVYKLDPAQAFFAAVLTRGQSVVRASQLLQVALQPRSTVASLDLVLENLGELPEQLFFSLPSEARSLQATWDGERVPLASAEKQPTLGRLAWKVAPPRSKASSGNLRVQWEMPLTSVSGDTSTGAYSGELSLPEWTGCQVTASRGVVLSQQRAALATLAFLNAQGNVLAEGVGEQSEARLIHLGPAAVLRWTARDRTWLSESVLRIPRAGLQTWLTPNSRQDWVALVVQTNETDIPLRLAADVQRMQVGVRVRGLGSEEDRIYTASSLELDPEGHVHVPLAERRALEPRMFVVEVLAHRSVPPLGGKVQLTPLVQLPLVWIDRMQWQVAYPRGTVLVPMGEYWASAALHEPSTGNAALQEQRLRDWVNAPLEANPRGSLIDLELGGWNPGSPAQLGLPQKFFESSGTLQPLQFQWSTFAQASWLPSLLTMALVLTAWSLPALIPTLCLSALALALMLVHWMGTERLFTHVVLAWPGCLALAAWFGLRRLTQWFQLITGKAQSGMDPWAGGGGSALSKAVRERDNGYRSRATDEDPLRSRRGEEGTPAWRPTLESYPGSVREPVPASTIPPRGSGSYPPGVAGKTAERQDEHASTIAHAVATPKEPRPVDFSRPGSSRHAIPRQNVSGDGESASKERHSGPAASADGMSHRDVPSGE